MQALNMRGSVTETKAAAPPPAMKAMKAMKAQNKLSAAAPEPAKKAMPRKEIVAPEYGARRHVFEKVKGKAFQTRITQYLIRNAPWRVGDGNEPFARDDVGRFSFIEYHFLELGPYGRFYKEFPSDDERPLASPKAEESDEANLPA
jgi:hypothetical protein